MVPGVECSVMPDGSSSSIDQETSPRHASRFILLRIYDGGNSSGNASHDEFQWEHTHDTVHD